MFFSDLMDYDSEIYANGAMEGPNPRYQQILQQRSPIEANRQNYPARCRYHKQFTWRRDFQHDDIYRNDILHIDIKQNDNQHSAE
jgi:hypothetical protein